MKRAEEVRAEHKLDAITHYLLKAFPGAAIVPHRAYRGDYLLSVCSAILENTHLLYVTAAMLNEVHPTVEELPVFLDQLQLSRLLREHGEYRLDQPC